MPYRSGPKSGVLLTEREESRAIREVPQGPEVDPGPDRPEVPSPTGPSVPPGVPEETPPTQAPPEVPAPTAPRREDAPGEPKLTGRRPDAMEKMMQTGNEEDAQPAFEEPLRSLLSTSLSMERKLLELLPELIRETIDPTLRRELEAHLEESSEHVKGVEAVFRTFGQEPVAAADPILEGLLEGHRAFMKETPRERRVLAVVTTAVAAEHVEIARYEVLRALAEGCGNPEAVTVIVRVLDQERQALKLVCESMHRLLSQSGIEPGMVEATPAPAG